jgi:hypothetical protein
MIMKDRTAARHVFNFNSRDNGGESLLLTTEFISNGDPGEYYLQQKLTLNSYCNCASIELLGATLNPDNLRQLANELEKTRNGIIEKSHV